MAEGEGEERGLLPQPGGGVQVASRSKHQARADTGAGAKGGGGRGVEGSWHETFPISQRGGVAR